MSKSKDKTGDPGIEAQELTSTELDIVTGGTAATKPKHRPHQEEFLVVKMTDVIVTS